MEGHVFCKGIELKGFKWEDLPKPELPRNRIEEILNSFPYPVKEHLINLAHENCRNSCPQYKECVVYYKDCETYWANVVAQLQLVTFKVNDQEIKLI